MSKNAVIILAAGRGTRAGAGLPKSYRKWDGIPVLRHTINSFLAHGAINLIQCVIHPDDIELFNSATKGIDNIEYIFGGTTRAASVQAGIEALKLHAPDNVLIHDGARPFVDAGVINRVILALNTHQGAIPALPVVDALWATDGDQLTVPVPRTNLVRAQTPQGFRFAEYANICMNINALDDAQAAMAAGLSVAWVDGDERNVKLTYADDFITKTTG